MQPADTVLPPGDAALIHEQGCSVRLKAIAATLRSGSRHQEHNEPDEATG